jgi:hypothetical protein
MSTTDQFLLALQAYQEIRAELHPEEQPIPVTLPTPGEEFPETQAASIPSGSLLLGMADDGLPVLLDLYDPAPGPILVAGDGGSGKTAFLRTLAHATDLQDPGDVQFGVLTPFPEEWTGLETLPNCLGIWPAYHPSAYHFLSQLVSWAEALPRTQQAILLLFDGLDLVAGNGYYSRPDLHWLLSHGPERRVWPVVSVNPGRLGHVSSWLDYFHTRVIGRVKHAYNARLLVDDPQVSLADLLPGQQFGLSQPNSWLRFWLPPLE